MQQQKHNVLVPAKRKHMRPQRHLARKIKTSLQRRRQRTTKLPFAHRTYQNPNPRRFNSHNLLPRHPKPLGEDRAQALVALHNIPKRSFQRTHIQRATKPNRQRDHVAPARPLQPLQKPQPTLPIRQRHLARTLNRSQRRTRRSRIPQPLNQPSYRRRLEQAADRKLNIKARTDAADQTRRQQRMATKRKEVILNPHTLQSQYLGKQRAQQLLTRIARQTHNGSPNLRRRQRTAVKLPVRRQRKTLQNNDRGRHHVVGKPRPNMRSQRRRIRLRTSRQNNIANKLRTPRTIRPRNHNRLRHARVPNQRCLDLPRLNAEAAHLNLMVRAPHKLQNPIGAPARQVPAAVHPAPRSSKPVGNKTLRRQTTASNIAAPNPSTRNVKLPNNPNRNWLQTTIQFINPRVPNRTTNRRCLRVIVIESHDRRPDRSLGRAIEIRDLTPKPAQGKGEPVREGLAADQHPETPQSFGAVRRKRMPECGCALKDSAAGLLDRSCKRRRILDSLSRGNGETGTTDEGEELFESGNIASAGRDGHKPIMPVKG